MSLANTAASSEAASPLQRKRHWNNHDAPARAVRRTHGPRLARHHLQACLEAAMALVVHPVELAMRDTPHTLRTHHLPAERVVAELRAEVLVHGTKRANVHNLTFSKPKSAGVMLTATIAPSSPGTQRAAHAATWPINSTARLAMATSRAAPSVCPAPAAPFN